MNRKFDVFSFVIQLGMASILIALAISILLKNQPAGERLALLGVLVIVSFFIMALVSGAAKNVPKKRGQGSGEIGCLVLCRDYIVRGFSLPWCCVSNGQKSQPWLKNWRTENR